MKTMKWLLRRELWEHKGLLFWAPLAVGAAMALFAAAALLYGHNTTFVFNSRNGLGQIDSAHLTAPQQLFLIGVVSRAYLASAAPIFVMLGFIVFFYCLGALHDERRDRSLLFWKSLPVSDATTVLSKALLALVVTPAIVSVVGMALALLMLLMFATSLALHGSNLFGALLHTPDFYLAPLRLLALLPIYILWALPTVGWLLLVSAWARSKVFLWAVGAPLLLGMLAAWGSRIFDLGLDIQWFMHAVVARLLLSVAPGAWFFFVDPSLQMVPAEHAHLGLSEVVSSSWGTLASPTLWVGVAAGVAMLAAATWLRRRQEI